MTPLGAYLWLTTILLLCGLGLPIPEDISLIAAGYFSYKGVLDVHTAFAVCFAAVLAGDTMAFFLGRFFGRRVLASPFARRYFTPRRQLRVRAYFRKFGSKVVLIGRFTPGFRFTIFFTAGTLHLRPSVFSDLRLLGGRLLRSGAGLLGLVLRGADRSRGQVHAPDRARDPDRDRGRARGHRPQGLAPPPAARGAGQSAPRSTPRDSASGRGHGRRRRRRCHRRYLAFALSVGPTITFS